MDPAELARQLFEEWKYRHEAWHKWLSRYTTWWVIFATLPLITEVSQAVVPQFATGFLMHVRQHKGNGWFYWLFGMVLFVACNAHLNAEYKKQKAIEERLAQLRGTDYAPIKRWPKFLWFLSWLCFFAVMFCIASAGEDSPNNSPRFSPR